MSYVSISLIIILIVLSVIGNSLVMLSALFNKRLRKYTHMLIVNLAATDFLISSFSLTLRLIKLSESKGAIEVSDLSSKIFCKYTTCVTISLFAASNFNLLLLTFDRYCAVNHALVYKVSFKRCHMIFLVATSLILAFIVGAIPAFIDQVGSKETSNNSDSACIYSSVIEPGYNVFINMFTFFAPLSLMIVSYGAIFRKIHRSYSAYRVSRLFHTSLTSQDMKKRERHISIGILFLLSAHTVLLAPISILDFLRIFGGIKPSELVIEVCLLLAYANPVVNAPTYAAASKEYHQTFKRLLCCFGGCQKVFKTCNKYVGNNGRNSEKHIRIQRNENGIWYIATNENAFQERKNTDLPVI